MNRTYTWGPEILAPGRARFRLWAPDLEQLTLEIDGAAPAPMQPDGDGWFAVEAEAAPGARYRFRVSDDLAVPDPASRAQAEDVDGWSLLVDPNAYQWHQTDWRGRPWRETVLYELHPGLLGGFSGIERQLPALKALGVTAIELMPVADFGGTRNWGYDGVLPYAPAAAYGTPDELKALVDAAHAEGLMVFLDVVYNHFGPTGNYLGSYASSFFDASVHTPWGAAIAMDREPVGRFFIENALMWLGEYRMDGLRFDAVHAIGNNAFLDEMAGEIRREFGDERQIHLVLENESNDADRLAADFDAQWNDDFHNVLHVLLTGESMSYYSDFAEAPAEKLARCLREGFIYQGDPSANHDGKPRGKPSGHLPPTAFVNFLQNHDQVGNRAFGERLIHLTDPERLRAATALMLLAPGIPLIFMGEEQRSEAPFLFFTDFHDELADAVREGRRREFAKFPAFSDPESREAIPDPNAPETFDRSRPEPGPEAETWRAFYGELLALRHGEIVPRLEGAQALDSEALGGRAVRARWRLGDGTILTLLFNLGDSLVLDDTPETPLYRSGDHAQGPGLAAWLERP